MLKATSLEGLGGMRPNQPLQMGRHLRCLPLSGELTHVKAYFKFSSE